MAKFLLRLRDFLGLCKEHHFGWADITQMAACEKHLREANLFGAVRRALAADGVFQS